ncbi:hypothetical protein [Pelagibius sp.]|uniref:hypothetical protein n=1 Tax=Pelagibius sp. TaxID=1931238 RepID=UPI0026234C62|nr:hypothetical protein [Pelagibius sp.]
MSMHTLNELTIHRARLLREQDQHDPVAAEESVSELDEEIISRAANTPDEAIAKLELARDLASIDGCPNVVKLIEGALLVLRH